jgi:hypothetical protein
MYMETVLKTSATVAGVVGGRQLVGLFLEVEALDKNGESVRLDGDNVESIRTSVASIAKFLGIEVKAFATVFDIPPVDLADGSKLRLDVATTLTQLTPKPVEPVDDTPPAAETEVAPVEFV